MFQCVIEQDTIDVITHHIIYHSSQAAVPYKIVLIELDCCFKIHIDINQTQLFLQTTNNNQAECLIITVMVSFYAFSYFTHVLKFLLCPFVVVHCWYR